MTRTADNTERDVVLTGLAVRVEATREALREVTWPQAARLLRDLARAAQDSEIEDLARWMELGLVGEAMASITPHGDIERSVAETTRISPRVMRRYRALARCILERPDRLVPLLAAGTLAGALRLLKIWREAERQSEEPVRPVEEPAAALPPPFDNAVGFLRKAAPSLALFAGAAIEAQARFEAEIARLQEATPPAEWRGIEAALDVVMSSGASASDKAEALAGAAMRVPPERTADGTDLVMPAPATAYGAVRSSMVVNVADPEAGRLAAVFANAVRCGAGAVNALLGVAAPALGGCRAELVCSGAAAAGSVEPDALVAFPFMVLVGEVEDELPAEAAAMARVVRHGVAEVRIAGRRLLVGVPSASALAAMRRLGVAPLACGSRLNEAVMTAMAVMETVEDADLQSMFAALSCRDWRVGGAAPSPWCARPIEEDAEAWHSGLASPDWARSGGTSWLVGEGDGGARPM